MVEIFILKSFLPKVFCVLVLSCLVELVVESFQMRVDLFTRWCGSQSCFCLTLVLLIDASVSFCETLDLNVNAREKTTQTTCSFAAGRLVLLAFFLSSPRFWEPDAQRQQEAGARGSHETKQYAHDKREVLDRVTKKRARSISQNSKDGIHGPI